MVEQKLRGSKWAELIGIKETLALALEGAGNEEQLREYIQGIINSLQKRIDKLEPNAGKR